MIPATPAVEGLSFVVGLPVVATFERTDTGQMIVTEVAVDVTELAAALFDTDLDEDQPQPGVDHQIAAEAVCEEYNGWVVVTMKPNGAPQVRGGAEPAKDDRG